MVYLAKSQTTATHKVTNKHRVSIKGNSMNKGNFLTDEKSIIYIQE